jgi:hypothetical protein
MWKWLKAFLDIPRTLASIEEKLKNIMSEIDQVLAADTATLAAVQGVATQLTTDVDNLITLIQNGDPNALAAAQALGTNLTALQTSLQSLDTAAQGAGGAPSDVTPGPGQTVVSHPTTGVPTAVPVDPKTGAADTSGLS